ncbi:hypothetical protein BXZ70DRAFT_1018561 [Cristinia sonorae]|uniref:Uncharacterized protein n=1 Tax=Cristinia sonorae TaxID=1940300 RepID=A0A8K0UPA4_9AGAR|nr:hypothetical protein BXZ70DRAFT_1018561 [Cristinia sonorae]
MAKLSSILPISPSFPHVQPTALPPPANDTISGNQRLGGSVTAFSVTACSALNSRRVPTFDIDITSRLTLTQYSGLPGKSASVTSGSVAYEVHPSSASPSNVIYMPHAVRASDASARDSTSMSPFDVSLSLVASQSLSAVLKPGPAFHGIHHHPNSTHTKAPKLISQTSACAPPAHLACPSLDSFSSPSRIQASGPALLWAHKLAPYDTRLDAFSLHATTRLWKLVLIVILGNGLGLDGPLFILIW